MGLLSFVLGLPLAPVRLVVAVAKVVQERAEQELSHPAVARRELEQMEEDYAAGEMSEQEVREGEERIMRRMTGGEPPPPEGDRR